MDWGGKWILVIGLGKTGVSVSRFLLKRGARLIVTDDKTEQDLADQLRRLGSATGKDASTAKLYLAGTLPQPFEKPALAVLSPGIPVSHRTVKWATDRGIPVISEIELAFRHLQGRVVAITGSNGKTTCTALIGSVLARQYPKTFVSGNIGEPMIDQVERDDPTSWHSVELSSFQLETIDQFRPDVAVLLNLTPDHLDRYPGMEEYGKAKERIFRNQRPEDIAILNADDPRVAGMAARVPSRIFWFSQSVLPRQGVFVDRGRIVSHLEGRRQDLMAVAEIPLRGEHNVANVLACAAAGVAAGVDPQLIADAVRNFKAVEHRLEFVERISGVAFFNDSKATNVDAAIMALRAFQEPEVVIMGGRDKNADFSELREHAMGRVRHLVLLGEAAPGIEAALRGDIPVYRADSMEDAVRKAFSFAHSGDIVLLAPACASFDMFRDYQHRGQVFKEAVRKLKTENE